MSIETDRVIADLASRNLLISAELADYQKRMKKIGSLITCIGGPLNDNKHGYTPKQLEIFALILDQTA